jgi:hypothetical protein
MARRTLTPLEQFSTAVVATRVQCAKGDVRMRRGDMGGKPNSELAMLSRKGRQAVATTKRGA